MHRLITWSLIIVSSLVGLVVGGVLFVVLLVDPNDYRDRIASEVEQRTGREMVIEGDLGLTFFPWFGIEMGKTRLGEASGFGDEPFATMDRVQLSVKVLPLLSGELRLNTIILERPRIRLIRDEQGRANWEQFPKASSATEGAGAGEQPAAASDKGADQPAVPAIVRGLRLAGLRVEDASVVYDDRQAGRKLTLAPFNLKLTDVSLGGDVPVEADWEVAVGGGPQLSGQLTTTARVAPDLTQARLMRLKMELTASGDAVPNDEQTVSLMAGVNANLAASEFQVEDLSVQAAGARLTGNAEAALGGSSPVASGTITIPEFDPRKVMRRLDIAPPATRDQGVLGALEADLEFELKDGRIRVEPLQARLDDSNLQGWVLVRDPAQPAADFDLELDRINVDRYLPPPSEDDEAEETAEEGAKEDEATIPTEPLRPLDLDGELRIAALTVSSADMEDVTVKIRAKDGNIRINPLTARLYEGQYRGDIRLDATQEALGVKLNERLKGVQAQPLLSDLASFSRLGGQGDVTLEARARGKTVTEILNQLKGQAVFGFKDGAFQGINLAQTLRQGMARLQGNELSADEPKQTDFTTLGGTVKIDGGRLSNDDLSLKTPLLRVTGSGMVNAITREIDYQLNLNVVGSLEGQGGAELQRLKGVPVPLRIKGALMDPGISLGLGDKLEAMAKQRVDEKKQELKAKAEAKSKEAEDKAKEKADKAVEDKIKDLLN